MKKKKRIPPKRNLDNYEEEYGPVNFNDEGRYADSSFVQLRREGQGFTKNEVRRKQNKKRRLKNGVRNFLITLGIVAFVAIVAAILSLTVFFNITTVNITGSEIYTAEELAKACTIEAGENLFLIDTQKCVNSIERSYPYIYSVKITRKLPATVNITVTDAKAVYAVNNADKTFILLDDNLKVLEKSAKSKPAGVIMITDAKVKSSDAGYAVEFEDENALDCITKLTNTIKTMGITEITSISSKNKNSNFIVYDSRITFELGSCDELEKKIYRGLAICEELNEHNNSVKGKINLTVDKQSYFTEE